MQGPGTQDWDSGRPRIRRSVRRRRRQPQHHGGADVEIFERVRRVISSYARAVTLMGGPGAGQLTKMCKQICIAELIQALTEGLNFAQRAGGLDPKQVVDVIA